jgi:hypothetical protein
MGVVMEVSKQHNALGHLGYSTRSVPTPRKTASNFLALSKEKNILDLSQYGIFTYL